MTKAVKQKKSPKRQLAANSNVNNYPNKIYAKSCESVDFSANVKSGEGGIRTRGTMLLVRRFSKPVLSATQPPLRHH